MPVLLVCTKEKVGGGNFVDEMYPKVKSSLQQVMCVAVRFSHSEQWSRFLVKTVAG